MRTANQFPISPPRSNVVTFFYQGNASPRMKAAFYSGGDPVFTEEQTESGNPGSFLPGSPRLLHNIYTYPEVPERTSTDVNFFDWIRILVFKIIGVHNVATFPYLANHKMSSGGKDDIEHHQRYLRKLMSEVDDEKKIVLFGCSRGAAVTMMSVATLRQEEQQRIALVILEGPYDSILNIIRRFSMGSERRFNFFVYICKTFIFPRFETNQLSPLDVIEKFPESVPVAFVSSMSDQIVPHRNVMNLVNGLKKAEHPMVHHLTLSNSGHSFYAIQDMNVDGDRAKYQEFVDMLYDKYT